MAAIYMWPPPGNLVVTTPLYPVEVTEGFSVSVDIESITFNEFVQSEYQLLTHQVLSGNIEDILLVADPVESEYQLLTHVVLSGEIEDILLIADPQESEYQLLTHQVLSGEILDRLIRSYAPDESIDMTIDVAEITYESAP